MRSGSRQHRGEAGGGGYGFPPAAGDKRTDSQGRLRHADRSDFRERQLPGAEVGGAGGDGVRAGGLAKPQRKRRPEVVDASTYFEPHGTELTITLTTTVSGDPEVGDFDINVDPDGAGTDEESDEVEVASVRLRG